MTSKLAIITGGGNRVVPSAAGVSANSSVGVRHLPISH
jgi:hypothetical protein